MYIELKLILYLIQLSHFSIIKPIEQSTGIMAQRHHQSCPVDPYR